MAAVRMFCRIVKGSVALQLFLVAFIAFLLYAFYVWKNANTFTTITKNIYRKPELHNKETHSISFFEQMDEENEVSTDAVAIEDYRFLTHREIDVIITFSNAKQNYGLQQKFKMCVFTLLKNTKMKIVFYIIGDESSQNIAENILNEVTQTKNFKFTVIHLDIRDLSEKLDKTVSKMQKFFSKPGAYYHEPLFFLSLVIHRVMPPDLHRVIMLDSDLKFMSDIKLLYRQFWDFKEDNILGIAREMQPVYRHTFWQYRKNHPNTRVGEPPPNGLTGFNSGVLLLDLDKMRKSHLYNSLIDSNAVFNLTEKYFFKGHLGDQDFFTLLSLEHENLFYILPCTWNRQLCEWWRHHGYVDVFDKYFKCEGHINIYHGNCNTPFPE